MLSIKKSMDHSNVKTWIIPQPVPWINLGSSKCGCRRFLISLPVSLLNTTSLLSPGFFWGETPRISWLPNNEACDKPLDNNPLEHQREQTYQQSFRSLVGRGGDEHTTMDGDPWKTRILDLKMEVLKMMFLSKEG